MSSVLFTICGTVMNALAFRYYFFINFTDLGKNAGKGYDMVLERLP